MSFRGQFQTKSGLTIIAALLLMLQSGGTHAANLKYVRTANHQDFIRIVFEFQNGTQFKEPETKDPIKKSEIMNQRIDTIIETIKGQKDL